jgi:23S rRNA (pseudouridine1915-N3)-methyltransferase
MNRIFVYLIEKNEKDYFSQISKNYIKMSKKFAKIEVVPVFSKKINKAQGAGCKEAQESYSEELRKQLRDDFLNICLDKNGKEINSYEFSKILKDNQKISFFIGGAYGFNEEFVKNCDFALSFGKMTFAHKLIKIMLLEQIFRGFAILQNHPYHK